MLVIPEFFYRGSSFVSQLESGFRLKDCRKDNVMNFCMRLYCYYLYCQCVIFLMIQKQKTPSPDRKGARTNHRRWYVMHEFPFSKEGGAVSGDTRRSYAMRIYPW